MPSTRVGPDPDNGLARGSLILSIICLVLSVIPIVNFLVMAIALVPLGLGLGGLARARRTGSGHANAWWGVSLSITAIVVAVLVDVATFGLLGDLLSDVARIM